MRRSGSDNAEWSGGLGFALALTVTSAFVWGVAHLAAGRRAVGTFLMALFAVIVGTIVVALEFGGDFKQYAVRRDWLLGATIGLLALALVWAAVVVGSYRVVRPRAGRFPARTLGNLLAMLLAAAVCAPLLWAARDTYTLRDTIGTIFRADPKPARPAAPGRTADPWQGRSRVNILLLGGDGAGDRTGVRTDSMTVASVDTRTGDTVMFSLPRNLQRFPVIPRLRSRWPDGFTGVAAGDQGLLNEMFQDAVQDPSLVPGVAKDQRGPELVREEISYLIGQPIDYFVLVNLFGFADMVDAIGGVTVHIAQDIPFGGPEDGSAPTGVLRKGTRHLSGKQALWYGRSRTLSSDFVRMGRQKCLLKDIAQQADPGKVLAGFQQLATAAKRTISTDIPAGLLPALVKLSDTVKRGAQIRSLMFVPPRFDVYRPDVARMRRLTAQAIGERPGAGPSPVVANSSPGAGPSVGVSPSASASPQADPLALQCG